MADPRAKPRKQKLNNNSTRDWLHGRMAIVPTPKKNKLGGRKAQKLPMLTGVKNVLDSDEEEEERLKRRKKREAAKRKKKKQRKPSTDSDTDSSQSSDDAKKRKKKKEKVK